MEWKRLLPDDIFSWSQIPGEEAELNTEVPFNFMEAFTSVLLDDFLVLYPFVDPKE